MDAHVKVATDKPGCPFATPGVSDTVGAAMYCRLPGGRVRVPTPDERVRYCSSGRYDLCPTLHRFVRDN